MYKKYSGAVTVFLAISFLLIMSLILVMLEGARYSARNSYSSILLKTAAESTLGEYYGPLYADYHLFGLDTGFGGRKRDISELERVIESYLGDNIWGFENEDCYVSEYELYFTDGGKTFLDQAYDYEKYKIIESAVEEVLEKLKLLGNYGEVVKVFERKNEMESEFKLIDECTIDLMREIDGIIVTKKIFSDENRYAIGNTFIKKLFTKEVSPYSTGINNPAIFDEMKSQYINPIEILDNLEEAIPKYIEAIIKWEKLEKELEKLLEEMEEKQLEIDALAEQLSFLYGMLDVSENNEADEGDEEIQLSEKDKAVIEQIEGIQSVLIELSSYMSELQKKYVELKEKADEAKALVLYMAGIVNFAVGMLDSLVNSTKYHLNNVISILSVVDSEKQRLRPMVEGFNQYVLADEGIPGELYEELNDSVELMKAYIGMKSEKTAPIDHKTIGNTVRNNKAVLDAIPADLFVLSGNHDKGELERLLAGLGIARSAFNAFSYDSLEFDYSGIQTDSVIKRYGSLFGGWASAVLMKILLGSEANISTDVLLADSLPSAYYEVMNNVGAYAPVLIGESTIQPNDLLKSVMGEESDISRIYSVSRGMVEELIRKIIIAMYVRDHFKSFSDKGAIGDTVLSYEMEYILSGSSMDSINLVEATTKILLLRFVVSAVYCFLSPEIRQTAEGVATALLGVTGVPFLVKGAEVFIISAWAFAQALVETTAILMGKEIPILTSKSSFCVSIFEIPVIPVLAGTRAKKMEESELGLGYEGYLVLFLLLQKDVNVASRSMDVVQANMQYRYNEDFLMFNCITGFSVDAEFRMKAKYMMIPNMLDGLFEVHSFDSKVSASVHY